MAMVSVGQADWSLHRKGFIDQERYNEKLDKAIKQDLHRLITREDIVLSDSETTIKVSIRELGLPKFRFDQNKVDHIGHGTGDTKKGTVIGKASSDQSGHGEAGDEPGTEAYEIVRIETLQRLLFENWRLPGLQQKDQQKIITNDIAFTDIRRAGIRGNLHIKRTALANITRNALSGKPRLGGIRSEDLRYRTWTETVKPESNALIIMMMDVSGSMGNFERYAARCFYFWMVRFLRTMYENVQIAFIIHHTTARIVSEEQFFTLRESGGTRVSSAYNLALQQIDLHYPPSAWNIYPFHFSDGENYFHDNASCVEYIEGLLARCGFFGFVQVGDAPISGSDTRLFNVYRARIADKRYRGKIIMDMEGIYNALLYFFGSHTRA